VAPLPAWKIGEDVTERLDVIAPKFRVIVTRRSRYACTTCRENIVQAPAPAHLIEGGLPTERLLASIAISKYADGLPLYRQEAIYAREKVELGRNLMANWMGHVGFHLEPLAERLFEHIRAGERIFANETTLPVLSRPWKNQNRLFMDLSERWPQLRRLRPANRCLPLWRQPTRGMSRAASRWVERLCSVWRLRCIPQT
jgi:transposase